MKARAARAVAVFLVPVGMFVVSWVVARPALATAPPSAPVTVPASVDVRYRNAHPPVYPSAALEKRQEGIVVLQVRVGIDGMPLRAVVDLAATHAVPVFVDAAVRAARHWRYNPRAVHGKVVPGWVRVPVQFRLPSFSQGRSRQ